MSEENTQSMSASADAGFSRDKDAPPEGGRFKGRKRRKVSYLTINKIDTVDYKDVQILRRFINDRGKILPSRQTGNTAKQQRMITRAINRARELALLPFVVQEMGSDRREYAPRRDRGDRPYREDRGPREERAPRAEAAPAAEVKAEVSAPVETPAAEAAPAVAAKAPKASKAPRAEAPAKAEEAAEAAAEAPAEA